MIKTCVICTGSFDPRRMGQKVCSPVCQKEYTRQQKLKKQKLETLKTRRDYAREAERSCNRFIRERDAGKPCISCGHVGEGHQAGHFRSVGSSQALRYHPHNIHAQCVKCNMHLSGNLIRYRVGLLEREGGDVVEYLENNRDIYKYTVDELKEIKEYYDDRYKELKRERT